MNDAVVLPAPLHPEMIYKFFSFIPQSYNLHKWLNMPCSSYPLGIWQVLGIFGPHLPKGTL